ncbi:SUKH-4 family immunity protein [Kitasatospora sp. NPDC127111]|uniref:SUKH-4 family immunity protein n=1 Tax=Kitasatospora sp. NPDC127111 TaxID=3345363 RepID=UPI003630A97D
MAGKWMSARVAAGELAALLERRRPGATADPSGSLAGAWERVLASFGPDGDRVRRLLAPLVLAEGPAGMPDELRLRAAAVVCGGMAGAQEFAAAEDAIAPLVAREAGGARLADAALAQVAGRALGADLAGVQRSITEVLLACVPADVDAGVDVDRDVDVAAVAAGRTLRAAQAYALRYGAGHALAGGVLDTWLADAAAVVLGDPQALAEAAAAAGETSDPPARRRRGAVVEAVRGFGAEPGRGIAERVARLRFAAQAWGDHDLVAAVDGLGLPLPWRAAWARWRPVGVYDPREFGPGWTGPVDVAGWRPGVTGAASGGEVCLRSEYDGRYRWYAVDDGEQVGGPRSAPPSADVRPVGADTPEVDVENGLIVARAAGEDTRGYPLCGRGPGAWAHPLPGGRVLLAGHSGAALVHLGPTAAGPVAGPLAWPVEGPLSWPVAERDRAGWRTDPALLPEPGWWADAEELTAEQLHPYFAGGVVRADRERLGAAGERPRVLRALCGTGLPGFPVFWQATAGCLESPVTLEEYEDGEFAEEEGGGDGYTVIAVSADESTPLCVEHATGAVVQWEGEPEPVNRSVAAFAACQALTRWALAVSATRQFEQRAAFEAFVRTALTRIDPGTAARQGRDWWWFQAVEDGSMYTLYG